MKKKVLAVVLVIAGLTCVGMIRSTSKRQDADQKRDRVGTYKERLQRAKARGDKKMLSHGVIPLYAHADLDQALQIYDVIIGEFVSSKSFATDDDGNIVTWYKFKVMETLSKANMQRVVDTPPAELYPLANDEILIWKTGGTVEVDGMEIEMTELNVPAYEQSKRYLLILAVDRARQAGTIEVGPSGALLVRPDDTMVPTVKDHIYFKREIENRYGASVSILREKLKKAH